MADRAQHFEDFLSVSAYVFLLYFQTDEPISPPGEAKRNVVVHTGSFVSFLFLLRLVRSCGERKRAVNVA